jgi:hypothetical protein
MNILASGKIGFDKYDLEENDAEKVFTRLDARTLAESLQYLLEATRGWSYTGNEGKDTAINNAALAVMNVNNLSSFSTDFYQALSTMISFNNFLDVDTSSTANLIKLKEAKIVNVNSPDGSNYCKDNVLPFTFVDNLTFRFKAKFTNTNAVQVQISQLPGLSGSVSLLNELGQELVAGDIIENKYYTIMANSVTVGQITTKRFLLKTESREASNVSKGTAYLNNPVSLVNDGISITDTIGFNAGTFITSTGKQIYLPIIRKKIQLSGIWNAGDTNNGLDTGVRTASIFYRTYVIQNNTSGAYDILFSLSATSPTVPSGYTNLGIMDYALIRTNASNIIAISNWDANNKKLVLGAGEQLVFVSSTAGAGNVLVVNTTEPLEFDVKLTIALTGTGFSDFAVYGSEQDGNNSNDCLIVGTNNGFTASNNGLAYTSNGRIYWKNFTTAGGVSNQTGVIKAIKIRN